ncbi:uncharacterized protein BP5553_05457 [Venustampulla echinocandica]|uniref:Heterokaryon incompatibility domain-containing protein n=1 Tax=Venustampulla echinocandica TaxID=2656787 RepID=A0A370TR89_9HELO|nr:uncharacterized protein BP5553_05457 [Venustampulla echinocandica]RDL38024.1 hypothetical protein BP5553_05457 [Venustampulla echinocandica]
MSTYKHPRLTPYKYSALTPSTKEIRILTLLPGYTDAPIRVTLAHTPLVPPEKRRSKRMSLADLERTLPSGWTVEENVEGHMCFVNETPGDSRGTFWRHPDPYFDRRLYELPLDHENPGFEPRYEALSYTWGSAENPEAIYVVEPSYPSKAPQLLEVGQNLASALRHLRDHDAARVMWIDAVCINQADIDERSSQVIRMTDIFKSAYRVIVWLGEEADESKLALSTMAYLGRQTELCKSGKRMYSPGATETDWYRAAFDLPYDDRVWRALFQLTNRPWFERLWIWQEIQLANSRSIVKCGHDTIPWSLFRRAAVCLATKQHPSRPNLGGHLSKLNSLCYYRRRYPFKTQLSSVWERKCANQRDKVYGVLGLAPPKLANRIIPQYSLPVDRVFKEATLAYLHQFQRLDMIQYCNLGTRQVEGPSWVLDMSVNQEGIDRSFYTTGLSRAQTVYHQPDILEVTGLLCTKVRSVSQPASLYRDKALDSIRSWQPPDLETASYITGGSLLDAYLSTVCFGDLKEKFVGTLSPTLEEWKEVFLSKLSASAGPIQPDALLNPWVIHALNYITGMSFMTTEDGHIGLCRFSAKPGDWVCLLLGCDAAILLRQNATENFQVVGACGIHGLSDSASLLGPLPKPWKVEIVSYSSILPNYQFVNAVTGEVTLEDPRLEPLPEEWERFESPWTPDDPEFFQRFRNRTNGEEINSDPRIFPEALKARGVPLRTFQLV